MILAPDPILPTPQQLTAAENAGLVVAGDFDISLAFVAGVETGSLIQAYYFAGVTPQGELSLRYDYNGADPSVRLRVRDVDALSTNNNPAQSVGGPTVYMTKSGDLVEVRAWYKAATLGTRSMGIRVAVNGVVGYDTVGVASGPALGAATNFYLAGNPSLTLATRYPGSDAVLGKKLASLTVDLPVSGVILGDSLVQPSLTGAGVSSSVYDLHNLPGVHALTLARGGAKVLDQLAAWQNCLHRGQAYLQWVTIQVGVNDMVAGDSAVTILTRLQSVVDDVRSSTPGAQVLICALTPFRGYDPTPWLDGRYALVQQAIGGGGPTPITNVTARVVDHAAELDDGTGRLKPQYDFGDGLHTNTAGRTVNANAYRAILHQQGLLP